MIIEKLLTKFKQENGGVIGSSVIEKGGFMVAMDAPRDKDRKKQYNSGRSF